MPEDERMTVEERYKYLRGQKQRYEKADRAGKGKLLDEMEAVTGLHRKSLLRLLAGGLRRKKRSRQRGVSYGDDVREAVLCVAETLDWVCAERLTPGLVTMATLLIQQGELELAAATLEKLEQISVATVGRMLASLPKERWRLPQKSPQPNPIAAQVAIERIPWDVKEAGHVEIDLVHHSGRSTEGEYLHTLQLVDVASGWSERRVVAGRSYLAVAQALSSMVDELPFTLMEVHSDNGGEFLNHHLLRFWQGQVPELKLDRSKPYHKNDSRFVEQKNSSMVRAYVGYQRLDSPAQARKLEAIYSLMRLYHNLYQPVMHLVEKHYVTKPDGTTKVRRVYDRAATPFERLVALGALDSHTQASWEQLRQTTSPRKLRERIYVLLGQLRSLPGASSLGDVRQLMASLDDVAATAVTLQLKEAATAR